MLSECYSDISAYLQSLIFFLTAFQAKHWISLPKDSLYFTQLSYTYGQTHLRILKVDTLLLKADYYFDIMFFWAPSLVFHPPLLITLKQWFYTNNCALFRYWVCWSDMIVRELLKIWNLALLWKQDRSLMGRLGEKMLKKGMEEIRGWGINWEMVS